MVYHLIPKVIPVVASLSKLKQARHGKNNQPPRANVAFRLAETCHVGVHLFLTLLLRLFSQLKYPTNISARNIYVTKRFN